nr:hypothetical protein CFP56_08429 [Quercus suber]
MKNEVLGGYCGDEDPKSDLNGQSRQACQVSIRVLEQRLDLPSSPSQESRSMPHRPLSGQKTSKSSLILVASNPKAISFLAVSNICFREKG